MGCNKERTFVAALFFCAKSGPGVATLRGSYGTSEKNKSVWLYKMINTGTICNKDNVWG